MLFCHLEIDWWDLFLTDTVSVSSVPGTFKALQIEGWAKSSLFFYRDCIPAVKAHNQQMYKHILCPVVISAIENNKEVWGDSREEETVSGWASYEGKPFWKSDTEQRPKWVTEGARRKVTPRGVTGTFFLGLHTKLYCALLILLQRVAYWNPERDHWLPGCTIWDLRLCWFATGYLSEQYWDHGQVLMGECGDQHMMKPLFAVAPCSGCWGLNLSSTSGATLAKPFGESSLSPLICTTEKLALWDTGGHRRQFMWKAGTQEVLGNMGHYCNDQNEISANGFKRLDAWLSHRHLNQRLTSLKNCVRGTRVGQVPFICQRI